MDRGIAPSHACVFNVDRMVRKGYEAGFAEARMSTRRFLEKWRAAADGSALDGVREQPRQDGVTTMTILIVFKDRASPDTTTWTAADGVHAPDGMQGSYDNLEDYLTTLA